MPDRRGRSPRTPAGRHATASAQWGTATQSVSPTVTVYGDLGFSGDFAGQLSNRLFSVPSGPVMNYCNTGHQAATNWFILSEVLGRRGVSLVSVEESF